MLTCIGLLPQTYKSVFLSNQLDKIIANKATCQQYWHTNILEIYTQESFQSIDGEAQHFFTQPRIYTYPESVVHDDVSIG